MKYRKKPVVIEAFQMTKERRLDNSDWPVWLAKAWQKPITEIGAVFCSADGCLEGETHTPIYIQTLEGTMKVSWDDFIIKEVEGELYACKPDIFEATHDDYMEGEGLQGVLKKIGEAAFSWMEGAGEPEFSNYQWLLRKVQECQ